MEDLYLSEQGDLAVSHNGDIQLTPTPWRNTVQQAYIRCMTDEGDFLVYPTLGASLSKIYGMPQSPSTGNYGVQLIRAALGRELNYLEGNVADVRAVPTGPQTIRFDVFIEVNSNQNIRLSVEQLLDGSALANEVPVVPL